MCQMLLEDGDRVCDHMTMAQLDMLNSCLSSESSQHHYWMKIIAYNVILSGAHRMATAGSPAEGKRADALNRDQWKKFFDSDGRLVNEIEMRKAMFEGYLYSNYYTIDTHNDCSVSA